MFLILLTTSAVAVEFPETGTFKQQSDYVNSLHTPCDDQVSAVVLSVATAENPFASLLLRDGDIKVWHHEFDAEYGVVMRRTLDQSSAISVADDVEEVMIGGESQDGSLQPLTFRFQRQQNGMLKIIDKVKVPVTEFAEGVEQAGKQGLVVRSKSCYTARLRDK